MSDFDQRAATWDANPIRVERARAVAQAIAAAVPLTPHMSAFEYGCGTGLLSFSLQPQLGAITLADNSSGMLAVLAEKIAAAGITNMAPLHLDLSTDALPAQRCQLIYTLLTLHHIPDVEPILRAFYAMLAAPGWLCIADLDKEDGTFHRPEEPVPHHGFARAGLEATLRQIGFSSVRSSTVYQIPRPVNGETKYFPMFLMVAEKGESSPGD
jgi:ubiquinone/menaquinone biosynthesis C-methylase UbiE